MKINALHKDTRVCLGIYEIDSLDLWQDHGDLILSPRHDGEVGWILDENNEWINPNLPTEEEKWSKIRRERNGLLAKTDWTQFADSPLSDELKAIYQTYRQALRDLPNQYANADDVVFPERP